MFNWLTRTTRRSTPSPMIARRAALRLETLEVREVPAVLIQVDYSYDNGFFANNPDARAVIELVASELGNSLNANLSAISPRGGNTWSASFFNPATGGLTNASNLSIGENTIKVFVGARAMPGSEAGSGGFGGNSISGSSAWINSVQTRGHAGFSPWGGSIAFDNSQNWYYGQSAAELTSRQLDFYSVATHEMGHVLGIGTSTQWTSLSSGGAFHGSTAMSVYGGAVPLGPDGQHWADGLTVGGQAVSLDPSLTYGQRVSWSSLDAAALSDLGWNSGAAAGPAAPSTVGNPQPVALAGSLDGTVRIYSAASGSLNPTGAAFAPFPGYRGEVRVATGDFNGDGVTDYAFSTGPGVTGAVAIVNGRDGSYLVNPTIMYGGFAGGLSIAAGDINHDGRAELIIGLGAGAPPLVQTFQVGGGGLQLQSSFIAFNAAWYTGGVHVAAGDINRDGYADVVVTSASFVGAAVGYSGAGLRNGSATQLFVAFAPALSIGAGLNVAVGDVDGDGYADMALSFDHGGPSIVAVWSGAVLSANPNTTADQLPIMGMFSPFGGDTSGVRLALKDVDGDGRADVVASNGNKFNSLVSIFNFAPGRTGTGGATPLGSVTVNGVYGALHSADDTSSTEKATYTVTAAPPTNKCTCPGCLSLARLADAASEPLISAIPVA